MKIQFPFYFGVLVVLFSVSCGFGGTEKRVAKGNRIYGGKMVLCEAAAPLTLNPYHVVDIRTAHILSQVHASLLRFNTSSLKLEPEIAESWMVSADGKTYTFKLRKGAMFQDDPCFPEGEGREITASDVEYSIKSICTKNPLNVAFANTFKDNVVGANAFWELSDIKNSGSSIEGIRVIDDYTIEVELERPNPDFIQCMAYLYTSILPKEGVEMYGDELKVGAGAFKFAESQYPNRTVYLVYNKNYFIKDTLGNQLPYLDSIEFRFVGSTQEQQELFMTAQIDLVENVPPSSLKLMIESNIEEFKKHPPQYTLTASQKMGTQYLIINRFQGPFKDIRVRKAFAYALNKQKIVDESSDGADRAAVHGITPPVFEGYDISQIEGYSFNIELAQKLLSEAGYPKGKSFPEFTIVVGSSGAKFVNIAFNIEQQLRTNLGLNPKVDVLEPAAMANAEKYLLGDLIFSGWVADAPTPANFLLLTYGKIVPDTLSEPSFPNFSRYKNPEFDALYEKAMVEQDKNERFKGLIEAEKLMIKEVPLIPIYHGETYSLVQSDIHGFFDNGMSFRDLSWIWIDGNHLNGQAH